MKHRIPIASVSALALIGALVMGITATSHAAATPPGFTFSIAAKPAGTKVSVTCQAKSSVAGKHIHLRVSEIAGGKIVGAADIFSPVLSTTSYTPTTAALVTKQANSRLTGWVYSNNLNHAAGETISMNGCVTSPSGATTTVSQQGSLNRPIAKAQFPAQVLNLANWYVTLPTPAAGSSLGGDCDPQTIKQPALAKAKLLPWFFVNPAGNGVVFRSNAGGCTTANSDYPRSELREMANGGKDEASWSSSSGTHTLKVKEAVTHLPVEKPQVVTAQIHDSSDDVIEIIADGTEKGSDGTIKLCYRFDGKTQSTCLDDAYKLGTPYIVQMTATGGKITIYYNGKAIATESSDSSGDYFKAGAYTQSNTSKGDAATAYGEVVIYGLSVSHTAG